MSIKKIICYIAVLVAIDQMIKVVIYHYFFNIRFDIIPSLLEFYPKFNDKYSYFNHLFNFEIGVFFLIGFVLIMQCIAIFYFLKHRKKYKINLMDYVFIFFEAGAICALLGYFEEKGVLDYIYLKPLFIFDLKDLYINIFICLLPICLVKKSLVDAKCKSQNN